MYSNGLKTIAVLVTEVQSQSQFQRVVCKHISMQAYRLGYNIAIFNWNNPYGQHESFVDGELEIFDLPDYSKIDAIIYLKDTFDSLDIEKKIEDIIMERFTGPCVSLRAQVDNFHNILIDDAAGIRAIVEHFIKVHKCKKIAFMTGKIEMLDAQMRLTAYKSTMDEYGIEYDESYIFYGDYWKNKGAEAVDHFEKSHYGMPEVIICANDYMVLAVMNELIERGYRIPDDIMVSGFDNISDSEEYIPSLTSLDVPLDTMGEEAVNLIHNVLSGEECDNNIMIVPKPVLRNSCGCHEREDWDIIRKKGRAYVTMSDNAYSLRDMRFFTVALENVSNLDELIDVVESYMRLIGSYKDFYICMNIGADGDLTKPHPSYKGYTDKMMCGLAINNRVRHSKDISTFDREYLIPPEFTTDEPQIFYFTPLHFLNKNYGYTAVSYSDYYGLQGDYYSFSTYLSNALDTFNDKLILQRTLDKIELLYVTDPLTSLYNRRGFEINAADMYADCMEKDVPFMVLCIDMDGLKYINDTHGHQQGDNAIQTLANALVYASSGKEICARVGGDEFNIAASNYTKKEMKEFIGKIFEYLDDFNESKQCEYEVSASYGAILIDEYEGRELEYYLNLCDKRMYADKNRKKASR